MTGGRPSKFKAEYVDQARKLSERGFTDQEIADFFDVAPSTLYLWKTTHPEFSEAIKTGGDPVDDRVERSLLQRACGYTYDAVKIMQYEGSEVIVPYKEHVAPDVAAAIFWLKNRRKDKWRDKTETGFTDPDGKPMVPVLNVVRGTQPKSS